jgi:hypothetical protein
VYNPILFRHYHRASLKENERKFEAEESYPFASVCISFLIFKQIVAKQIRPAHSNCGCYGLPTVVSCAQRFLKLCDLYKALQQFSFLHKYGGVTGVAIRSSNVENNKAITTRKMSPSLTKTDMKYVENFSFVRFFFFCGMWPHWYVNCICFHT